MSEARRIHRRGFIGCGWCSRMVRIAGRVSAGLRRDYTPRVDCPAARVFCPVLPVGGYYKEDETRATLRLRFILGNEQ